MTVQQKNKTNLVINLVTSTGILTMCIYGFISYGRMANRVENCEAQQKQFNCTIERLDEKKADKQMVIDMWEDVKYIRQRIDEHMNHKEK